MNRELLKMLLRSIRQSLGRYLSILGIIALGVGFFAGLKSSYPAMQSTAGRYFHDRKFHDFQLLSSLGFTESDCAAFSALDGVEAAEGARFSDVYLTQSGKQSVCHMHTKHLFISIIRCIVVSIKQARLTHKPPGGIKISDSI